MLESQLQANSSPDCSISKQVPCDSLGKHLKMVQVVGPYPHVEDWEGPPSSWLQLRSVLVWWPSEE